MPKVEIMTGFINDFNKYVSGESLHMLKVETMTGIINDFNKYVLGIYCIRQEYMPTT